MAACTIRELVRVLGELPLLSPTQQRELGRFQQRQANPKALVQGLVQRGWLTAFQGQHLLQGQVAQLLLGPYLLLDNLGEGGMGQVFKARHLSMNRLVALKVLRKELAADAEAVGRFRREMEVLSQISHPHLVHAYEAGPIGSSLVLAMEYVEGIDLDRRVRKAGRLPVAQAAEYVRQAAQGLQHAHERGLVHRDVKPANLLVTQAQGPLASGSSSQSTSFRENTLRVGLAPWALEFGVVKVLDLGLARLQQTGLKCATADLTLDYGRTAMQGTPDYMAPEQALDFHTADIRADVYSLGCTFFFLLTGQPPFPAQSLAQKLMKHQQAEPPEIRQPRPEAPAAIAAILGKMLAKRPADRFQTPGAVAAALTDLFTNGTLATGATGATLGVAARPTSLTTARFAGAGRRLAGAVSASCRAVPRFCRRRPRLSLAAAALLLLGLGMVLIPLAGLGSFFGGAETREQAALRGLLEGLNLPDLGEAKVLQRLNAFDRTNPGMRDVLREGLLAVRLRQPGSAQALQAGIWLTYLPSPLDQLDPGQIPEKQRFPGQPAELVAVLGNPGASYTRVTALAFRPDCKLLACAGPSLTDVLLWEFGNSVPHQQPNLRGHGNYLVSLAFSPDGKWLASGGGNNAATGDNHVRLWGVTQPEIKAEAVFAGHTSTVNALAFSPDSRWLVSSGQDHTVRLWEPGQREGVVLAPKTTFVNSLAFSPDGGTLAIAGTYWNAIRLMKFTPPQPGTTIDLKNPISHTFRVAYSPNGQSLASTADKQIAIWDTVKEEEAARLTGHAAAVRDLVYLPFGSTLLSGEAPEENQANVNEPEGRIILWNIDRRTPSAEWRLPCGGIKRLALASDGRHLAVGGRNSIVYILRLGPPKLDK